MFGPLSEWFLQTQRVDLVFYLALLVSIFAFLVGEGFWFARKIKSRQVEKVYRRHFEAAWSLIPLLVLLSLTFVDYRTLRIKKAGHLDAVHGKAIQRETGARSNVWNSIKLVKTSLD